MDSRKRHHYFKSTKSNALPFNSSFHRNNYDSKGKYSYFKSTRLQKQPYKRKNEFTNIGNFRSVISHKKALPDASKKQILSPEDSQEEERRRKLSDTANKLLSKIKTWSAENNCSEDLKKPINSGEQLTCNLNTYEKLVEEPEKSENCSNVKVSDTGNFSNNKIHNESRPKRIAHSMNKISKLSDTKKTISKNINKITKMSNTIRKYDLNNAAVKDFQNKIQHKLINEIMQMPREDLQNVLNNPKINPIMQVKMSHLVKKNKLLIAQKLRALAESKMSSKSHVTNSPFFFDIDKFIDPVIETDFSALPYELIKQMEDIFQVQFDYSDNSTSANTQPEILDRGILNPHLNSLLEENYNGEQDNNENTLEETIEKTNTFSHLLPGPYREGNVELIEIINCKTDKTNFKWNDESLLNDSETRNVKEPNTSIKTILSSEDLTVYECSTDEDEDTNDNLSLPSNKKNKLVNAKREYECLSHHSSTETESTDTTVCGNVKKRKSSAERNDEQSFKISDNLMAGYNSKTELKFSNFLNNENNGKKTSEILNGNECSNNTVENAECLSFSRKLQTHEYCSTGSQTENNSLWTTGTQTFTQPDESETVYGLPIPKESTDETSTSLLQEVNSIQNLINKLSERRFMIFLKLARIDPHGDFITDSCTQFNFIESVSSGNSHLADLLKQFFVKSKRNLGKNSRTHHYKQKKYSLKNRKTNDQ